MTARENQPVTRIAMWSGPRNISTAMMYSFANRPDCAVWDEPFYAYFLANAGIEHPMNDEVINAGITDYDEVARRCCLGPEPAVPVFYQKHMTHHMLPGCDLSWTVNVTNAFLIRDPLRVLASYVRKREEVTLRDIGFAEQAQLFDHVAELTGTAPPVVDSDDVRSDPAGTLGALCDALGIGFNEAMLSWPAGPKPFDGVWARHWYNAVWQSDGFAPPPASVPELPEKLGRIADAARPYYEKLKRHALRRG